MTAQAHLAPFHGSYLPEDCQFLLTPIEPEYLSIEEKERRIQTGQAHYSEMIHRELPPSEQYLALFDTLCERYAPRLAKEVRQLARQLAEDRGAVHSGMLYVRHDIKGWRLSPCTAPLSLIA